MVLENILSLFSSPFGCFGGNATPAPLDSSYLMFHSVRVCPVGESRLLDRLEGRPVGDQSQAQLGPQPKPNEAPPCQALVNGMPVHVSPPQNTISFLRMVVVPLSEL